MPARPLPFAIASSDLPPLGQIPCAGVLRRAAPVQSRAVCVAVIALLALPAHAAPALAPTGALPAAPPTDSRPYDAKLMRLAELLGTIHYLRELCGAGEGQFWRDTMQELMKSEGFTAIRRSRLTRSFNQGYRSYSRTYNVCTPTARAAIERFLTEGATLSDQLSKTEP